MTPGGHFTGRKVALPTYSAAETPGSIPLEDLRLTHAVLFGKLRLKIQTPISARVTLSTVASQCSFLFSGAADSRKA